ncbi:putative nuclease HARBI1 [Lucilia sericata]|uniref:putative nuclease HARBI1 n=1 Tax=Lucilia sericata TaxID=13632 RepID=UPI0018A84F81|nr:putative nuclease HARBI1 [Lucilia sericata]
MDPQKALNLLMALKQLKDLMDLSDEELRTKERRVWINPTLAKRKTDNIEARLLADVLWEETGYRNYSPLNIDDFERIHEMVYPKIKKQDTVMRVAITARIRLAITLRYLATGDSLRALEVISHISRKTMSQFLPEVLRAIIECLQSKYLKLPSTKSEWLEVANEFEHLWQFPHTLGAIDGKHIRIKTTGQSTPEYFNNKGYCSIVLFALVDAHSKFLYVDVSKGGRDFDDAVFKNSTLNKWLKEEKLKVPADKELKGQLVKTPYYFIGDDIFVLERHVMKPYNSNSSLLNSQQVFNERLRHAMTSVDIAFSKLAARFRILCRPIEVSIDTCGSLVKACCLLHNYLSKDLTEPYPFEITTAELPETMSSLPPQCHERVKNSKEVRENIRKYLLTEEGAFNDE